METDMAKTFTNIAAQGDFIIIRKAVTADYNRY